MSNIQAIRRRIRSVTNTSQITKAMELVAASKMRRAQEATVRARPYAETAYDVLLRLVHVKTEQPHPLFQTRPVKRRLIIVMTSDKGLAGAYNSNILRLLLQEIRHAAHQHIRLIVIGQKGAHIATRLDGIEVEGVYTNWPTEPKATDIRPIARTVIQAFTNSDIDQADMLYTEFITTVKQQAVLKTLLPLRVDTLETEHHVSDDHDSIFEPSPDEVLAAIVPRLIESQIFQANLEAIASEHSMRMMAMKNASDNAEEIIDDLTLTYNGARQASITQELAEITAGAQAIT